MPVCFVCLVFSFHFFHVTHIVEGIAFTKDEDVGVATKGQSKNSTRARGLWFCVNPSYEEWMLLNNNTSSKRVLDEHNLDFFLCSEGVFFCVNVIITGFIC